MPVLQKELKQKRLKLLSESKPLKMNLVKISGHCVWLGLGVEYSLHTVLRELEGGPLGKVFSVSPGRSMHQERLVEKGQHDIYLYSPTMYNRLHFFLIQPLF